MKTVNGWAFPSSDDFMVSEMKPDGSYQLSHLENALTFVTDLSCAVDAGAHVGTWSKRLSRAFLRVIAVEPAADTFEALATNMFQFGCANVEMQHCALGKEHGMVEMAPLDPRADALKNTGARFVRPGQSVRLVPLDSWVLPTLGFLKLDIEGSEVDALMGARETLTRCRPIVLWENKGFWRRFGYPKDAPQTLLTSLGYHEVAIAGCDRIWGPTK